MFTIDIASFSRTVQGDLRIALDDVAFARADVVFVDPSSREISALLDGMLVTLGVVSQEMAESFMEHDHVILSAPHPHGHELTLVAPVLAIH